MDQPISQSVRHAALAGPQTPAPRLSPWVWAFALGHLAIHLLSAGRYGYFRDELYYLACSRHLAFGYVDHPPLVVWFTWVITHAFGDSLLALRLMPAVTMAGVVVLCGWLARALGGGRFAQALAALVAAVTPAYLAVGSILTMNPLDILWWTLAVAVLIRLIERPTTARWVGLGVIFGLGGLTKLNIAFFAGALLCGVLLTRQRRWLGQLRPWMAVAIALVVVSPLLVWQQMHGWPTLDFLRTIRAEKNYPVNPIEFIAMQFAVIHPMIFPIWTAGLVWLLRGASARPFRLFGWAYVALFLTYCGLQAKFYYLFPIYPILFAAGGVAVERWTAVGRRGWRVATVAIILVTTLPMIPLAAPILPFDAFLRWNAVLDIQRHLRFERGRDRQLPILYSDMLGWPELAAKVGEVYHALPASERAAATIFTHNYGEAAALDFFGPQLGLPRTRSPHNGYHIWGPGHQPWTTVIAVGFSQGELEWLFADVTPAGAAIAPHAREQTISLHVCRGLRAPTLQNWSDLKRYR